MRLSNYRNPHIPQQAECLTFDSWLHSWLECFNGEDPNDFLLLVPEKCEEHDYIEDPTRKCYSQE